MTADERLLRAVLMRFAPGCALALAAVPVGLAFVAPDELTWGVGARLLAELGGMTLGFAAALRLAAPRLHRVRSMGLRSVGAGLVAPFFSGILALLFPVATLPAIVLLCAAAGAAALLPTHPQLLRVRVALVAEPVYPVGDY